MATLPTTDGNTPRLSLLVIQPTPFCNIDCSYCYLSRRAVTSRMTLETLRQACRCVFDSPRLGAELEIAWHAGEPLVVPLSWYREATAQIAAQRPPSLALTQRFQTNGLLMNDEWGRFFADIDAKVGVSIDGPEDIHDANRRSRAGKGTHAGAMRAIRLLQGFRVPFHVITVITRRTLAQPDRLFDFYLENEIEDVWLNTEEIEGANLKSSLSGRSVEAEFRRFISRFFELCWSHPGAVRVRELETMVGRLLAGGQTRDQQNLPFAIVSIGYDGSISTFSPELLDARHPRFGEFTIGHVATHRLCETEHAPVFRAVSTEINRGVAACRRTCPYFAWCGGGAPVNKLFETGRFDVTETTHCRLTLQIMLDEALRALETRMSAGAGPCGYVECTQ